jgi:hypothetical protein
MLLSKHRALRAKIGYMKINVNDKALIFEGTHVTYEQIVELAGDHGHPTVVYHAHLGGDVERSGEMHTGCAPLAIVDGMTFDVVHTGNA